MQSLILKLIYYIRAYYEMHILRRIEVGYMPEYLGVEVTNVCNFSCSFCPQSDPNHHSYVKKTFLSLEKCDFYLKKIRDLGIKTNLIHWTLDGEPFMHKEFHKLCEIGLRYGFTNAYFATNGMLCTIDRLIKFPINDCRFTLSIDFCADPVFFEEVRGTKDSWNRIYKNIKDILSDKRLSNIYINLTDISSYSTDDKNELNKRFFSLKKLFGNHSRIEYRTKTFHNATGFLTNLKRKNGKSYHLCPYPWTTLRVAANGDIVACCRDLRHETVLGNLNVNNVKEIWNGEPMQELRKALLDKEPEKIKACNGCDMPYDDTKFTVKNIFLAAKGRIQLFTKTS